MKEIIGAVHAVEAVWQTTLQKQPSLLKDGSYEIVLLQAALRIALGDKAGAVLDEIWNLTAKARNNADF